mgnify:CR=1 FL=1
MPQVYSTNGSSMRDVQIESDGTLCAGNTSIRAAKKNIVSQTDVSWLYDLNDVIVPLGITSNSSSLISLNFLASR